MSVRSVTVDLGDMRERVDARIRSGAYETASDVVQAGLRALDREEADFDAFLREAVHESLDDARPNVPADEVFGRLRGIIDREAKRREA